MPKTNTPPTRLKMQYPLKTRRAHLGTNGCRHSQTDARPKKPKTHSSAVFRESAFEMNAQTALARCWEDSRQVKVADPVRMKAAVAPWTLRLRAYFRKYSYTGFDF